jgi:GrpB-like predicted nucleotidyltransferase (UPF0157 family)
MGSMTAANLRPVSDLMPQVESILDHVLPQLRALLPEAEVHHIGATAMPFPGAMTKGDVDVLVHVSAAMFPAAVAVLRQHFQVKQPENWTSEFASFGDDRAYALPLGIQVVVKGSKDDFLLFLRDYFNSNPHVILEYSRLKIRHAGEGQEKYWQAKDAFLANILAAREGRDSR